MSRDMLAVKPEVENPICSIRTLVRDGHHNAFTNLVRWRDELYLTYRRSSGHAQGDGDIILLRSKDGQEWKSCPTALQSSRNFYEGHMVDLGDRLCMFSGAFRRGGVLDKTTMKQYVSFSSNGRDWSPPQAIYKPLWRFWRPIAHEGTSHAHSPRNKT